MHKYKCIYPFYIINKPEDPQIDEDFSKKGKTCLKTKPVKVKD